MNKHSHKLVFSPWLMASLEMPERNSSYGNLKQPILILETKKHSDKNLTDHFLAFDKGKYKVLV